MLIAPPAGGHKCHFLRPVVLRMTGILASCSALDGRLCCAVRCGRSPAHTPTCAGVRGPSQCCLQPNFFCYWKRLICIGETLTVYLFHNCLHFEYTLNRMGLICGTHRNPEILWILSCLLAVSVLFWDHNQHLLLTLFATFLLNLEHFVFWFNFFPDCTALSPEWCTFFVLFSFFTYIVYIWLLSVSLSWGSLVWNSSSLR